MGLLWGCGKEDRWRIRGFGAGDGISGLSKAFSVRFSIHHNQSAKRHFASINTAYRFKQFGLNSRGILDARGVLFSNAVNLMFDPALRDPCKLDPLFIVTNLIRYFLLRVGRQYWLVKISKKIMKNQFLSGFVAAFHIFPGDYIKNLWQLLIGFDAGGFQFDFVLSRSGV